VTYEDVSGPTTADPDDSGATTAALSINSIVPSPAVAPADAAIGIAGQCDRCGIRNSPRQEADILLEETLPVGAVLRVDSEKLVRSEVKDDGVHYLCGRYFIAPALWFVHTAVPFCFNVAR
jgi:hypothetical protein